MTLTTDITLEERDALFEQILSHISGIDDLRLACQVEDFETAERLGIEFGDELRLMEDLGWGVPSATKTIELTMPPEQLHRVFTRLRSEMEDRRSGEERDEAEVEKEAQEFRAQAQRVTEACERVLSIVGRRPPPGGENG